MTITKSISDLRHKGVIMVAESTGRHAHSKNPTPNDKMSPSADESWTDDFPATVAEYP